MHRNISSTEIFASLDECYGCTQTLIDSGAINQIVIYGSWGTQHQKAGSDIDILIIGNVSSTRQNNLDVKAISERLQVSPRWLGSELANHVASFGSWLVGANYWGKKCFVSDASIRHKADVIIKRSNHILLNRKRFPQSELLPLTARVFVDAIRLGFLSRKASVPPTGIIQELEIHEKRALIDDGLSFTGLKPVFEAYIKQIFDIDAEMLENEYPKLLAHT